MKQLGKHWKGLLVRGVVAIIFGLLAIFVPGIALPILAILFGVFAFVDGIIAFFVGIYARSWGFILEGVIGILIGLFTLFYTDKAILLFLVVIALWALITGIFEIIAAIELRRHISDEIWLLMLGIISILFGIVVFVNPLISAIAISIVIGVYAILFGIFLVALSLTVKSYAPKSRR